MKAHLLIGAAASGSGKTTFTLGLLRALKNRAMRVQPFKCGPDYIDTRHHRMAAGRPSVNLDPFMMSASHLEEIYHRYAADADVAVAEGVMGLFDGYDGMQGSSAETASALGIPVVLVVNARSTAYSVAPLLYGFKHFRREIQVVGAVFNFVASASHYAFLEQACRDAGVEPLGYLPKQADVEIPSRHLGLTLEEDFCFESFADRVARLVEEHVDIDRLLELTEVSPGSPADVCPASPEGGDRRSAALHSSASLAADTASAAIDTASAVDAASLPASPAINTGSLAVVLPAAAGRASSLRIVVASDAAFQFMYEENLRLLSELGHVRFFSPLNDTCLPPADLVYLPGGYPELHLAALSANRTMRESIRAYIEADGKLLAECGGMMYLCNEISDADGTPYPMVGVLNQSATMQPMKLRLGYRTLDCRGCRLRGHEFHYSRIIPSEGCPPSAAVARTAKGVETDTPLYRYKQLLAGYTHLYWADPATNDWFYRFLDGRF